jgi:hypothetical protein
MKDVHLVVGVLAIVLNAAAGSLGGWRWWRAEQSLWFWRRPPSSSRSRWEECWC